MGSLTSEVAALWRDAAVPRWVPRWVLTTVWVAALVVAIATDDVACTPLDPSVCGPDPIAAGIMALAVATPVLLVWMPRLGCAWGAAFPLVLVAAGEPAVAALAFGVHGVACAAVLVRWSRSRGAQQRVTGSVTGGVTRTAPPLPPDLPSGLADPRTAWNLLSLAAAGLALLAGLVTVAWTVHVGRVEARHAASAAEVLGDVVAVDDLFAVTVAFPDASGATRQVTLDVLDAAAYPVGSRVPLLIDPRDERWVRLVAEPRDPTLWLAAGIGALFLAALLAGRELRRRWALQTLWLGPHPALDVLVVPDGSGDALVFPCDVDPVASAPVAVLPTAGLLPDVGSPRFAEVTADLDADDEWDADGRDAVARAWRGADDAVPDPERATLVGAFHDGGWALLLIEDGVLVPAGRLRTVPRPGPGRLRWLLGRLPVGPWRTRSTDATVPDATPSWVAADGFPGQPVRPQVQPAVPTLPATVGTTPRSRALGAAMVLGGFLGGPAAALLVAETWYQRGLMLLIGGELVASGLGRLVTRLHLRADHLELSTGWRRRVIPWGAIYGVRREGQRLILAWYPDVVVQLPELDARRFGGSRRGRDAAAEALGSVLATVHERVPAGTDETAEVVGRGPIWPVGAIYLAVAAMTLWAHASGGVTAPLS